MSRGTAETVATGKESDYERHFEFDARIVVGHWFGAAGPGESMPGVQALGVVVALGYFQSDDAMPLAERPFDDRVDELIGHSAATIAPDHPHRAQVDTVTVGIGSSRDHAHGISRRNCNELSTTGNPTTPLLFAEGLCLDELRTESFCGIGEST